MSNNTQPSTTRNKMERIRPTAERRMLYAQDTALRKQTRMFRMAEKQAGVTFFDSYKMTCIPRASRDIKQEKYVKKEPLACVKLEYSRGLNENNGASVKLEHRGGVKLEHSEGMKLEQGGFMKLERPVAIEVASAKSVVQVAKPLSRPFQGWSTICVPLPQNMEDWMNAESDESD